MQLTDNDLAVFDQKVLKLPAASRETYTRQVDYLIESLAAKIREDGSFGVRKFLKAGSLQKRTVLKPRDGFGVDADIAIYLKTGDDFELDTLHDTIRDLLITIYPQKLPGDFQVQPRTLGIEFHQSGLDVDLVPVMPLDDEPGDYGLQPSSRGAPPIKTSIPGQLNFIQQRVNRDQNYRRLVRMLKYWRNRQELDDSLRSFAIELITALYWLLSTSFRERGPLGFHRQPLSLCQVELSHGSRRGIVLFHQKKHRGMDIKSSGKVCKGCLRGLPKTPSAMTLRAGWNSSTSRTLAHVVQLQAAQ